MGFFILQSSDPPQLKQHCSCRVLAGWWLAGHTPLGPRAAELRDHHAGTATRSSVPSTTTSLIRPPRRPGAERTASTGTWAIGPPFERCHASSGAWGQPEALEIRFDFGAAEARRGICEHLVAACSGANGHAYCGCCDVLPRAEGGPPRKPQVYRPSTSMGGEGPPC